MIEVKHLTKRYGTHLAVDDLSFSIEKGVIYGFLGPNGAGKSTTMNIITGCLGASSGEVLIDGHNIMEEPGPAKAKIGYLPELPPLYQDMTTREYLQFVASAKGVKREDREKQMQNAMDKTRIADIQNRLIRNLSKGYRQRVGIAQALLGDPEVIILDEPTVGLDPKQIIEIRELIRELGKTHTIVLSSHILSEVQAVCDHIMIISKGKLVASDTPEKLTELFKGQQKLLIGANTDADTVKGILDTVTGIQSYNVNGSETGTTAEISPDGDVDIREALSTAFVNAGHPLTELHTERASLEDVFLELTQNEEAVSA